MSASSKTTTFHVSLTFLSHLASYALCLVIGGLQGILCTYRSLYSIINYKLLDSDLKQLQRQYQEDFTEVIQDYDTEFQESFCKQMKDEFSSQLTGIEELLTAEVPDFQTWCSNLISSDIAMFSPKINKMASITGFWGVEELCGTLEMAYNELKKEYDENQQKIKNEMIIPIDGNQKDILKQNLFKLMNILPFELFIEK